MNKQTHKRRGFTIVELLIVIVVIAILATISVVAYNGIQARSHTSKIESDLTQLEKAIVLARINQGEVPLTAITGGGFTGASCSDKPSGTDLAALPKTDQCWVSYLNALDSISTASHMDVRSLVDPWGRPYLIDENEGVNTTCGWGRDLIMTYTQPFLTDGSVNIGQGGNRRDIQYVNSTCN